MKRYLILILCVLLFNSCGKFLEEFSQDLAYAESCADLDEILIVLKPYGEDPAWVLPIPGYEIVYNQGNLVDNPQRVERELE